MQRILILFISITLYTCKPQEKEPVCFDSIEISYDDTWYRKMSVFIDSTKHAKIKIDSNRVSTTYYSGVVIDTSFIKINQLLKRALKTKYNDQVGMPVPDGIGAYIILKSKYGAINSLFFDNNHHNTIDTIIHLLIELKNYQLSNSKDTTFYYESMFRMKPPKPIEEDIPFIKE